MARVKPRCVLVPALLFTAVCFAAETPWTVYQDWPFGAEQAKRRQQETADALKIPVRKSVLLQRDENGDTITMDLDEKSDSLKIKIKKQRKAAES